LSRKILPKTVNLAVILSYINAHGFFPKLVLPLTGAILTIYILILKRVPFYLLKQVPIDIHLLIMVVILIIGIRPLDYILAITSFAVETIVSMTDWFIYLIVGVSLPITENLIPRGIM